MRDRVPALVVSGFLGSGKTTLVRRLLEEAQHSGVRVAVVANDFGDLGIDRALLARPDDSYVELTGGCVCCRLSDQLVETLQELRERARPERIIVETSGVALPYDTQLNFWREPVAEWIGDDAAVVVVNAEQMIEDDGLDETFEQQVSSADLLLLNKIDLVPDSELPRLEARLRELEPEAPIVRSVRAAVDPALMFPPDPRGIRARRRAERTAPPPHRHDQFEVETLRIEEGVDAAALVDRLRALGALRTKGFVETSAGMRAVQGVGARVELAEVEVAPPEEVIGRLVVVRRRASEPG